MLSIILSTVILAVAGARAESHTVSFVNKCLFGTPTLAQNGTVLSTGETVTVNGPLIDAIAYLQTGSCGLNGEGCTVIEITLQNPTTTGTGSSCEISLFYPYAFSVASGFDYYNGCDGVGARCTSATCATPLVIPGELQASCQANNVDIVITFCD
ncbi:hypothetical protein M0805_001979 [Coniferiporia weirii]|nr:hypothetical protein M0805_001979 [Coniferiporia weirii]